MKVQPKKAQQKLKVEDALAYLAKVKAEFDRKPQIYTKFLDIMKNFKAHTVDTGVIQQVSQLFRGHDALILGFNTFLPEEQRISLEQLKKMNKAEEEKKKAKKESGAATQGEKEKERSKRLLWTPKPKNQKGTPGQPFGFDHAISYVTKIKRRFAEKPATYREFLDILHLYKEQSKVLRAFLILCRNCSRTNLICCVNLLISCRKLSKSRQKPASIWLWYVARQKIKAKVKGERFKEG